MTPEQANELKERIWNLAYEYSDPGGSHLYAWINVMDYINSLTVVSPKEEKKDD